MGVNAKLLPGWNLRRTLIYLLMIAGSVVAFLAIERVGADTVAPEPTSSPDAREAKVDIIGHVLLALVVVMVASRLVGALFKRIGQPAVIGEVAAGILLGPSLLGRIAPGVTAYVLPPTVAPYLAVIAQVGIILYMFVVGLELDKGLLRGRSHASLAVSHASIIAPFLLGAALALWLYPRFSTSSVSFDAFALFIGVSMSVTAFPVLARILTDRNLNRTQLGTIALACAAVDDVTAWCLLALVVSVVKSEPGRVLFTVALTMGFLALMVLVVRPWVLRFVAWRETQPSLPPTALAGVCIALLLSALATELIGIHALFGAFLLGALVPHDSTLARDILAKLEDLVVVLFLPAFFAFTGMRTQIGLVSGLDQWLACGLIILVASVGKFGGSLVAARLTGLAWREAAGLGVLMNTRGLMELIVLNVGLDLGVLSPTLFAMFVIMALVTTLMTTPALQALGLTHSDARRSG